MPQRVHLRRLVMGSRVKEYSGGVRHDYKDGSTQPLAGTHRWPWFGVGLVLPLLAVYLLSPAAKEAPPTVAATVSEAKPSITPLALALPEAPRSPDTATPSEPLEQAAQDAAGANETLDLVVKRGDNLDTLFRRNALSIADLHRMTLLPDVGQYLRLLKPGDEIKVTHDGERILTLNRELDDFNMLSINRGEDDFVAKTVARKVEKRTESAHGVIESSLFEAGLQAGISDTIIMNMAGIFQWDIDFLQDVRIGDEFTVIYEQLWRDGVKLKDGEIVAAEFINRGTPYRAARYVDTTGHSDYFTPQGRSVRKAFIRAPVDFTRISSNFDLKRKHPILNKIRAHRGVDYAAPTGTPIKAAGDGKVIFRGQKNGYGNTIILQHGGNITTLYGHMSRFAKPKVGSRVEQGQIIGYVGQSGLATGPHLHYEYQVNGVHRNPRTVKLPPADPVPAQYWEDFQAQTATLWHQLDLYDRVRVATASD
jgi:murein DD-endopeptidase MepM/ murein hydrolase activator NlpD